MRVMFIGVALASLVGAALAVSRGDFTAAALCSLGFWAAAFGFVAYINAKGKLDGMIQDAQHEDEEDE